MEYKLFKFQVIVRFFFGNNIVVVVMTQQKRGKSFMLKIYILILFSLTLSSVMYFRAKSPLFTLLPFLYFNKSDTPHMYMYIHVLILNKEIVFLSVFFVAVLYALVHNSKIMQKKILQKWTLLGLQL